MPALFLAAFFLSSCGLPCARISGPNDISYSLIENAPCSIMYESMPPGGIVINSTSDFDAMCPGSTVPASWNFTTNTYLVINAAHTASEPYLAGVGNDPSDANGILVTVGLPCNRGIVLQVIVFRTFTLEISKTSKTLRVEAKDE